MGQELGLDRQAGVFSLSDRFAEMDGIPVNDDGGEQVEPGHVVMLAPARAVADFAPTPNPERVLERVMSLAPVQASSAPGRNALCTSGSRRCAGCRRGVSSRTP